MASDELHDYIHNVLETGDNGPHRHIIVDKATLNDAIDKYRPRIGMPSYCCNTVVLTIRSLVHQARCCENTFRR